MARKRQHNSLPTFKELIVPTIKALLALGGSGTIEEINERVYRVANISEEVLRILHGENGLQNEVDYRLAWSRTYLKKYGLLDNSTRGIWALTKSDLNIDQIDSDQIVRTVLEQHKQTEQKNKKEANEEAEITEKIEETNWKEPLLDVLFSIPPEAFERLSQRLLRESGFIQVEVIGKTGDGGIDGKGIVRISGFLSFHVIFQCKRYKGSITPSQIRDFRGAMQGRADKGLFITTGTFTRDAMKEATRDGDPPIDLIDGETLCDKLKEFKLGVETKLIESVEVNNDWFNRL
ncbi:MAG TPA: restriction endonuclease [Candidatus Brocadiaceae bacterium]